MKTSKTYTGPIQNYQGTMKLRDQGPKWLSMGKIVVVVFTMVYTFILGCPHSHPNRCLLESISHPHLLIQITSSQSQGDPRSVSASPGKPPVHPNYYHATPVGTGDYVVMSGKKSQMAPVQLATSYQRGTSSGIANAVNVGIVRAPSPEPTGKPLMGKTLLPYNVTPPRPMGPTEAERKIEELTRQLEEEMEQQEEEGEYFGE
uniref:Uncharacterized protein n=1 Tax=Timema genevievae TaxID=629358 RepID=A0A7R9PIC0_TIMGE|nr:unnamed protein product [Timema genevievae]